VIHPQAIIDPGARLAANVQIGAFSIIGPDVEIGEGTWIGPHVVIHGPTVIGRDSRIYQFCSLGEAPQHTGYRGEPTRLLYAVHVLVGHHGIFSLTPVWLLSAFFALTLILTQPMSNQAAAVVVLPVAVQTAVALGLNPRTFAVMIAVAASTSFITPLEPASLLVYGPGRYRFADFLRVGLPLTVVIYALAIFLVPRIWPL